MFPKMQTTRMLSPTPGERTHERVIDLFLFFLAAFGISSGGRLAVSVLGELIAPRASASTQILVQLLGTVPAAAAVILWVLFFERRSSVTMGLVRRRAVSDYLIGIAGGVLLFGGAVGLGVLLGAAEVSPAAASPSWWLLGLFFVGFLIQGMSEELLFRSYLMVSLSRKWPIWACVLTNAALFSAVHLLNPGIAPLPLVNIFLFGVLASLLTLRLGSIWMAAAVHSLWNFAQGNLFGIPVSGLSGMPAPLSTRLSDDTLWHRLVCGGDFGIEGGLAATAVLGVGILVVMMVPMRRGEVVPEAAEPNR